MDEGHDEERHDDERHDEENVDGRDERSTPKYMVESILKPSMSDHHCRGLLAFHRSLKRLPNSQRSHENAALLALKLGLR